MKNISVINTISVPAGMEATAEHIRAVYIDYFRHQDGFVSSTFYKSICREEDNSIRYINIVVWASQAHFENELGQNEDGYRVLGRGFPEPIRVSPGQYEIIS